MAAPRSDKDHPMTRRFAPLPLALVLVATALLAGPPKHAEWELTFHDDFDGDRVDWDTWESQAGARGPQKLESRWPENNVVRAGILDQVTRREPELRAGKAWTTAHIWTRHFQQQYGYFEARMRYGRYLNNAFWLFRPLSKRFPDPPHFEIDINEGHTPSTVNMTFHYTFADEATGQRDVWSTGKSWTASVDLAADFHLYGVEWTPEAIVWYFDGQPVRALANRFAHAPADVRLSTVIMPHQLDRDGTALDTMDSVSMAVDWVRVYRKTEDRRAPAWPALEPCNPPELVKRERQVQPGARTTVVLREDFQAAANDQLPSGWRVGNGHPSVVPEEPLPGQTPAPGNKVLRLEPGDYAFRLLEKPLSGRLEVELDYYGPARKDGLLLVTLGKFDPDDARALANSYYTADVGAYVQWRHRFLYFYTRQDKWTPFAPWASGRWNRFRFLIDVSQGVVDAYGAREAADFLGGALFRNRQKEARGIALRHHGTSETLYVDNLVVRAVED